MKKRTKWLIIMLMLATFPFMSSLTTEAQHVQTTNGMIGFTGVYEPIGAPDPTPPASIVIPPVRNIARPQRRFPQTNAIKSSWLVWLGMVMIMIIFLFLFWKRKKNKRRTEFD